MSDYFGIINRIVPESKQTLGWFDFYKEGEINPLIRCAVLELPFRDNQTNISSICSGVYTVKKRHSQKFGWHFILEDVGGREYILIHKGNYYTDIKGCLLFGNNFTDINGDGYLDVTISKRTMDKLLDLAPDKWKLIIYDSYLW